MNLYQTLKRLSGLVSVSGAEETMAAFLKEEMTPLCDEVTLDAMGNVICKKHSSVANQTLLLSAHMDEIGFVVCDVEEKGFVLLAPIGGIHAEAAAFSRVRFESGRIGCLVPPDGTKAADLDEKKFVCDIGAKTRAAACRAVKIGERCATLCPVTRLGASRISGRALDNRIGVAVLLALAAELKDETALPYHLVFAFTVQEEVGLRGAAPVAFATEPSFAINVDITPAGDGFAAKGTVKLGDGVTVKYKDRSVVCSRRMIAHLNSVAEENKIPTQAEILTFGGTDTGPIQSSRSGVVAGAVSVPLRYVHTDCETADEADIQNAVRLLSCAVKTTIQ